MDTMKIKQQVKRLYDAAFPGDPAWNTWFFDRVYRDDQVLVVEADDRVVSSLCLQKYGFEYHGETLSLAYISGVTTDKKQRHKGYMKLLLEDAIHAAYNRGDAFVGLIPATRRLFFLYDKFGFATVVYADIMRYASLHNFSVSEGYESVEPTYSGFAQLVAQRKATIIYSNDDFENILYDINHDKGIVVQINASDGNPAAMAFAVPSDREIHVKELLGINEEAKEAALAQVKFRLGIDLPMAVWCFPIWRKASLRARGMIRIANVEKVFSALGKSNKSMMLTIRVTDPLVGPNNGIFRIENGSCQKVGNEYKLSPDLDVGVDVLARILFSSEAVGRIFGIPSSRPAMSLMLD